MVPAPYLYSNLRDFAVEVEVLSQLGGVSGRVDGQVGVVLVEMGLDSSDLFHGVDVGVVHLLEYDVSLGYLKVSFRGYPQSLVCLVAGAVSGSLKAVCKDRSPRRQQ